MKLPLYFNCFFFDKENKKTVFTYKIEGTRNRQYPFQLFKRNVNDSKHWQDLSIYASVHDALKVLTRELISEELSGEIYHGQATVNPQLILQKIDQGERSISIFDSKDNETFRMEIDIAFQDLVVRAN